MAELVDYASESIKQRFSDKEFAAKVNAVKTEVSSRLLNKYYSREIDDDFTREILNEVLEEKIAADASFVAQKEEIRELVFNILRGNDVLEDLINDDSITEIMVNGYENIYIERNGRLYKTEIKFFSEKDLEDLIQRIVSPINRSVNESHPIVDAHLENGDRVNVVLPPVSLVGPVLTIRKFGKHQLTIDDLTEGENPFMSEEAAEFLKMLVRTKHNLFISGGTGSGKTTLLNILSNFIPEDERIITIEDSAELKLTNVKDLISMEKRNANDQNVGEITIRDLIKTSLRMRPDRIIVGEVRGEETIDMLQAMNTGHDGSLSTGHANSAEDMLSRLETMAVIGTDMPISAIRDQISSAVDYIVHISRMHDKSRKLLEISEVLRDKDGKPCLNKIYEYNYKTGKLVRTKKQIVEHIKIDRAGEDVTQW